MGEVVRGIFADHLEKPFNNPSSTQQFKVDDEVKIHVKLDMLTGIGQVIFYDKENDAYIVRFFVKDHGSDSYEEEDWCFFANELELYHDEV